MATVLAIALLIAAFIALGYLAKYRNVFSVYDYQRGLLYRYGKFQELLEGGKHTRWGLGYSLSPVDLRLVVEVVGNQKVLTRDGLAIRLSASVSYAVVDARKAIESVQSFHVAAYTIVQLAIRDAVTGSTAEELLEKRASLGEVATGACVERFAELGLKLDRIELRDITFPGELKKMFAQVTMAQKESQAALERARGESAALRSLANAAKMLEGNPALLQLRTLQALSEAKGATVVLNMADSSVLPVGPGVSSEA